MLDIPKNCSYKLVWICKLCESKRLLILFKRGSRSNMSCGMRRMSSKIILGLQFCVWVQKKVRPSEKVKDRLISKSLGRRHEKLVSGESNWKRKNCSFLLRSSWLVLAWTVLGVLSEANELVMFSSTLTWEKIEVF